MRRRISDEAFGFADVSLGMAHVARAEIPIDRLVTFEMRIVREQSLA